jgi:type I restriction enzyme R subunit
LKEAKWDIETNIFTDIFNESIQRINPDLNKHDIQRIYAEVSLCLENEDLGKVFYEKLINKSGDRLLDLENFDNNSFHVCTELTYKKEDEEFRPVIVLRTNN